jgi:hypothetical protein
VSYEIALFGGEGKPHPWIEMFGLEVATLMVMQVKAIKSIGNGPRLPTTDSSLRDWMVKEFVRLGKSGEPFWIVRCVPLHGGLCSTVGAFPYERCAQEFAAFWGNWVSTEVRTFLFDKNSFKPNGDGCFDSWERMWLHKPQRSRPTPLPERPRPFRRPGPMRGQPSR